MSSPVNMNQILFQAPAVEKVQQPEQQNPEQAARYAQAEEMVKTRQKTETVQTTVHPEGSKETDKDGSGRDRDEQREKKRRASESETETRERLPSSGAGRIVDVVV